MRCLALAQAWQHRGGKAVFATSTITPALEFRLRSEGFKTYHLRSKHGNIEDARETLQLAQKLGASWIVLDGYQFGSKFQKILKEHGPYLLFIDDNGHADHYYANIVLNQNLHANQELYRSREQYTNLLLGTRYALLRQEFWPWTKFPRIIPKVARKVLVTLGGSDPDNVTLKVINALNKVYLDKLEVITVIGGGNLHHDELVTAIAASRIPIYLKSNAINMPELMAWADMAVTAGGTTSWELAFMRLPSIILVIADNQCQIAQHLDASKTAINLGWYEKVSPEDIAQKLLHLQTSHKMRAEMAKKCQKLVDGKGGDRVVDILAKIQGRIICE